MKIFGLDTSQCAFHVTWSDRSVTEFPFIWLRDNDRNELHPQTKERIFDLTSVTLDIRPVSFESRSDALVVTWPAKKEPSVYAAEWLLTHRPGTTRHDPAVVGRQLWDGGSLRNIPRADAQECRHSATALKQALRTIKRLGLIIFHGLADDLAAGAALGDLIGFKRETNFGRIFEVISKPDPNNLAYTSMALPLHTDLPNQQTVPGYQFLHCYRNDATGGESIFADGFRICADFSEAEPASFELLTRNQLPWRFRDESCDIRRHRPIVSRGQNGVLERFVFNAHIADVPDLPTSELYDFYAAYRALMVRVREPKYALHYRLASGEMVAFDNWRVLHGRTAFDTASGDRHFRGFYIEPNEIDSRIRTLSQQGASCL